MKKYQIVVLALVLGLILSAWTHGKSTSFDPNQWGGPLAVSCLTSAITDVCDTGYNASCNGSSDDSAAFASWKSAAIAANPTRAVLYIPPGASCQLIGDIALTGGINTVVVWAYGVTFRNSLNIGGSGYSTVPGSNALVQNFNPGDSAVTLVTPGDVSIFSVGDWVSANCISMQNGGDPPNFYRFNYRSITNISGSVLTLNSPLDIQCKTTFPANSNAGVTRGPASLFKMIDSWNTDVTVYGLTTNTTPEYQPIIQGRKIALYNVTFGNVNDAAPTVILEGLFSGVSAYAFEVDKNITSLTIQGGSIGPGNLLVQSASVNSLTLDGVDVHACGGTAFNSIIRNTTCHGTTVGPIGYGHGNSITITDSTVDDSATGSNVAQIQIAYANFTRSTGTLIFVKSGNVDPVDEFYRTMVPGQKYVFAFANSFGSVCAPLTAFTVTDLHEDGTNLYADTDLGSTAAPTGFPCNTPSNIYIVAYPAATITQTNSGPADLTQFAAPP